MRVTFYEPADPGFLLFELPAALVTACRKLDGTTGTVQAALKKLRIASGKCGEISVEENYIVWQGVEHWFRVEQALSRIFFPDGEAGEDEDCEVAKIYDSESGTKTLMTLSELYSHIKREEEAPRPSARHLAVLIRFRF